jgi:xanthine dehydrogenase accessory factor
MTLEQSFATTACRWLAEGRRVVAATLIDTDGSAPLDPGATMLIDDTGQIEGSVTGGCVEGALVEEAQEILAGRGEGNGRAVMRTYGISDSQAVGVGLMCGGTVHILVHELPEVVRPLLEAVGDAFARDEPAAVATLVDGDSAGALVAVVGARLTGTLGHGEHLDRAVERDALGCLVHGSSVVRRFGSDGEVMGSDVRVFVHAFASPPEMIIFGAIDFSAATAAFARPLGYRVTICDAREPFLKATRFGVADELAADWPDRFLEGRELTERDVVLVFTHDPKFDEPALRAALATGAGYIGALGSRQTHEDRVRRLLAAGVEPAALERVAAPCGLDIGARTPEETAVSVLAEVVARTAGGSGRPLSATSGAIHSPRPVGADR